MTTDQLLILMALSQGFLFAFICAFLAGEKNRTPLWFVLGLLFGPLAYLALAPAPVLEKKP